VSGKRSKGALRAFLAEDELDDQHPAIDSRAVELQAIGGEDPVALSAIHDVFANTTLLNDPAKIRRILRVRSEIEKKWLDARDSFLAVGRALLSLEETLSRAEFIRLRRSTERLFPFSEATATQLRQIARAVDSGRLPHEQCPGSYGTAYQITLLTENQLRAAQERGLIRSDVTRREIMQLRRDVRVIAPESGPAGRLNRATLRDERKRLAERRERLVDRITSIEQRITQIDSLLDGATDSELA
jgi:hypothetical protein